MNRCPQLSPPSHCAFRRFVIAMTMGLLSMPLRSIGQEAPSHLTLTDSGSSASTIKQNATQIVREANRLLLDQKAREALDKYQEAQTIKPDAREIAFGEGLANFRLGEFDKAREAFNRAAGGAADGLADDAMYSLGTCDHAEALATQDPNQSLAKLESAMRNYQGVLADRPEHPAAREANLKAASYWRQLKQQLEQQKQEQQQNSDQNKDEQNNEQQQQQDQKPDDQQQKEDSEQQQQQSQQNQDQEQNEEQKQQQSADEQKEPKEQEQEEQQQQTKEENVSREQAERKLREMMQALRDRKKLRREEVKAPVYRPSEKDW